MIVSMPQIAVSTVPVKAPATPAATPDQFAAALSQATNNVQDSSSGSTIMSKAGNSEHGSADPKGNAKNSVKTSASNNGTQPSTAATLTNDNITKVLNNPPLPISLSALFDSAVTKTNNQGSSSDSDSAGKSEVLVPTVTSTSTILPPQTGSSSAQQLNATPDQTSATVASAEVPKLTSTNSLEIGTLQPASSAQPVSSNDGSKAKASSDAKPTEVTTSPATQNLKNLPANAGSPAPALPKPTPVESKPVSRESVPSGDAKSSSPSSVDHRSTGASVPQLPIVPPPTIPPLNVKAAPTQAESSATNAAVKTNSDAVSATSASSKKDGDAAQDSSSQSGKSDASAGMGFTAVTIKSASPDPQTQANSGSAANMVTTAQVSQPVSDAKAPSPSVVSTANSSAKPAAQTASAAQEAESSAETVQFASPIQIAKLVERAGQTDLRVGIQAGEFGSVDIRTSMAHSQFTAEISVERGELGRAMSAELPSLHDRLAEQRVPPANIIVQNQSYSQSGSSDLRQGTRHQQYAAPSQTSDGGTADLNPAIIAMDAIDSSAGLDIHI